MSEKKRKYRLLPGKKIRVYDEDGTPRDLESGDTVELFESAALAFKDALEPIGKSAPPSEDEDDDDEDGEDEEGDDDGADDDEEVDEAAVSEDAEPLVEKKKKKKKKKSKK